MNQSQIGTFFDLTTATRSVPLEDTKNHVGCLLNLFALPGPVPGARDEQILLILDPLESNITDRILVVQGIPLEGH